MLSSSSGNSQKQLVKLVQTMRTVKYISDTYMRTLDFLKRMEDILNSVKLDSWSYAIRAYSTTVSIKERQEVAKATLNFIAIVTKRGEYYSGRKRLENVPDLFASVANLCDDELLQLEDSQEMIMDIFQSAVYFTWDGIKKPVILLMEANWAGLFVRSLKASLDNPYRAVCSINWLLGQYHPVCKIPLIIAGLEEVVEEVIKKYPSVEAKINKISRKILKRLKMEEDEEESENSWEYDQLVLWEEEDDVFSSLFYD